MKIQCHQLKDNLMQATTYCTFNAGIFLLQAFIKEDENDVLKEMLRLTQQEKLQDIKLLQNL